MARSGKKGIVTDSLHPPQPRRAAPSNPTTSGGSARAAEAAARPSRPSSKAPLSAVSAQAPRPSQASWDIAAALRDEQYVLDGGAAQVNAGRTSGGSGGNGEVRYRFLRVQ